MFLLASRFYFINCISRWIKTKSNHFTQREGFTSGYSNSDQDSTRGKNVTSTAITTRYLYYNHCQYRYSTASSVSKVELFITLPKYIGSFTKTSVASKERKRKQAAKLEDFTSYRWKSRCLFMRQILFSKPTLVYSC